MFNRVRFRIQVLLKGLHDLLGKEKVCESRRRVLLEFYLAPIFKFLFYELLKILEYLNRLFLLLLIRLLLHFEGNTFF